MCQELGSEAKPWDKRCTWHPCHTEISTRVRVPVPGTWGRDQTPVLLLSTSHDRANRPNTRFNPSCQFIFLLKRMAGTREERPLREVPRTGSQRRGLHGEQGGRCPVASPGFIHLQPQEPVTKLHSWLKQQVVQLDLRKKGKRKMRRRGRKSITNVRMKL